jgi:hypothetical protein
VSVPEATREELLDALRAVREAIDIPHAATVGEQEDIRAPILDARLRHTVVMLQAILDDKADYVAWKVEYLRARLAEHPAEGYKTWAERVAELEAAGELPRKAGGVR